MDERQCQALIDNIELAMKSQGVDLYEGAKRLRSWLNGQYSLLEACESRASLTAYFSSETNEPDARTEQYTVLLGVFPTLIEAFLKKAIVDKAAMLPKGPVGRPLALTLEEKRDIVETVGLLHKQGVRMGDAQLRASRQFGIAKRTVERVWRERASLAQQQFLSLGDVWRFLNVGNS
jgi:hypothetical protein